MVDGVCYLIITPRNKPTDKGVSTTPRKTTTSTEVKRRYNEKVYAKIQVELPKETVAEFKTRCKEKGISQARVILEAIERFLRGD